MSRAKYIRGEQIKSVAQFEATKSQWFKLLTRGSHGKTVHRAFLTSLQYHTLAQFIYHGMIYEAKLKDESATDGGVS